jgi:hypothetical protein
MILEIISHSFAFVLGALAMALYLFVRPATLLKWRRDVVEDLSGDVGFTCPDCGRLQRFKIDGKPRLDAYFVCACGKRAFLSEVLGS